MNYKNMKFKFIIYKYTIINNFSIYASAAFHPSKSNVIYSPEIKFFNANFPSFISVSQLPKESFVCAKIIILF